MEFLILKKSGEKDTINLSSDIFDTRYNEILLHQLIVSYVFNSHKGTKKQKSRGLVRGGGKKPWKQKGTGRARVGSIRSPLWRGGGKIFASKGVVKKEKKINKKVYKLGIKIIFSELFRANRMFIIEDINILNFKTKTFINEIKHLNIKHPSLFIFEFIDLNINLATRNINNLFILSSKNLNPVMLLKFKFIFITVSAIKFIEEYFK